MTTPLTRAELLKMKETKDAQLTKQNVDLILTSVIYLAENGKTVYDLDIPLYQDLIEDTYKVLKGRLPDSKIEILEKTTTSPKTVKFLGIYWNTSENIVRTHKTIRIDWSV